MGLVDIENNKERLLYTAFSAVITASFFVTVLSLIHKHVNTHAISDIWKYSLLSLLFVSLFWVGIFMVIYSVTKNYSLGRSDSDDYHGWSFKWISVISTHTANLALLSGSIGVSLIVCSFMLSKLIAIYSPDHYFICLLLCSIIAPLMLYIPTIFFRFITGKQISLRFDHVLFYYGIIVIFFIGLPIGFVDNYFLSGEINVDLENVVDKDVKLLPVKIEVTGDCSSIDEVHSIYIFACNLINETNDPFEWEGSNLTEDGINYHKMWNCNITDHRIPIMKVTLLTIPDSNSTASCEMDSICFSDLTACNESKFLSGCGEGNGKFNINITVENLDSGEYRLIFEKKMGLKYIEELEIL